MCARPDKLSDFNDAYQMAVSRECGAKKKAMVLVMVGIDVIVMQGPWSAVFYRGESVRGTRNICTTTTEPWLSAVF